MKKLFFLFFSLTSLFSYGQVQKYITVHQTLKLMGSRFDITVVSVNEELGYINIDEAAAEIKRIEKMISSWDPYSETSLINANAGVKPVKVSNECFKLIERAIQISEITDGAFDISFAPLSEVWKFDGSMGSKPQKEAIQKAIAKVGYEKIELNGKNQTVFLKHKGMKISFDAIGKGYAADKAKELLVSKQVVAGVINASGDLTTWGTKASGEKWLIGIANPLSKGKIFSWLPLIESSVATSNNFEKYVTINEVKYSHIISPKTGLPIVGINSVSVFAKRAEIADALATAMFVMGREAGMALIDQLGGPEVIIVDDKNVIYKSKGILLDNEPIIEN